MGGMRWIVSLCLVLSASSALAQDKPKYNPIGTLGLGRGSASNGQSIRCFDHADLSGEKLELDEKSVADLTTFNFDNQASACCFYGVWILYENPGYNNDNYQAAVYTGWGEEYCSSFPTTFDNKASSLRFAGAPDGYNYDVLTLYAGDYFIGREQYFYDEAPQLNFAKFGRSAIVNGCSPWTLYSEDNYKGNAICLHPADESNCYPGFFPKPIDLGILANVVSSVKRGCHAKAIFLPRLVS